jgi:hypothetical protein
MTRQRPSNVAGSSQRRGIAFPFRRSGSYLAPGLGLARSAGKSSAHQPCPGRTIFCCCSSGSACMSTGLLSKPILSAGALASPPAAATLGAQPRTANTHVTAAVACSVAQRVPPPTSQRAADLGEKPDGMRTCEREGSPGLAGERSAQGRKLEGQRHRIFLSPRACLGTTLRAWLTEPYTPLETGHYARAESCSKAHAARHTHMRS